MNEKLKEPEKKTVVRIIRVRTQILLILAVSVF